MASLGLLDKWISEMLTCFEKRLKVGFLIIVLIGIFVGWFLNSSIKQILISIRNESSSYKSISRKIVFRKLLVQLGNGVIYGAVYHYFDFNITSIAYALLGSILLMIGMIDYYTMRIPNSLIIIGGIIGSLYLIALSIYHANIQVILNGILGMFVGILVIGGIILLSLIIFRKEGMGVGDLKLLGMIGLFIGSRYILYTILIAVITGGCYGVMVLLIKKDKIIPFAPFLSLGAMISVLWGDTLWGHYINYIL